MSNRDKPGVIKVPDRSLSVVEKGMVSIARADGGITLAEMVAEWKLPGHVIYDSLRRMIALGHVSPQKRRGAPHVYTLTDSGRMWLHSALQRKIFGGPVHSREKAVMRAMSVDWSPGFEDDPRAVAERRGPLVNGETMRQTRSPALREDVLA